MTQINELYTSIATAQNNDERNRLSLNLAQQVQNDGVSSINQVGLIDMLKKSLKDSKSVSAREGAICVCNSLFTTLSFNFEPYFIMVLPDLIKTFDDKVKCVTNATEQCLGDFFDKVNPYASSLLLPYLFSGMGDFSWKIKVGCLNLLGKLAHTAPTQIGGLLPDIVPKVADKMWDTKLEVKAAAKKSLVECCTVIHNPDVKPIVPHLINANANPKENTAALDLLMGTTFVSQVDRPTLAIIVPLLTRGLRDRDVQTKRKCCVVIDNMVKLVCDVRDVEPFVDKLLPELKRVEEEVPIPEIRAYGAQARKSLEKAILDGGGRL